MAAFSMPAFAVNDAMLDLLKILRDKGSISAAEYEALVAAAKADGEHVEDNTNQMKTLKESLPKVTTKDKITIGDQKGDFEWAFIGRVMADYIFTNDDETNLENGGELRRARLGVEATLWEHWIGKLEVDHDEDELSVKDAYVGYEDEWNGNQWWTKWGQQHVPFGFATLTSSKYMTFMNRPIFSDNEIEPARQMGVGLFIADGDKRWTGHAGVFAANLDEPEDCIEGAENTDTGECDQELAAGLRITGVPFMQDKTHLMHLGGGIVYRNPNGGTIDVDQRDAVIHIIDSKNLNADFKGIAEDSFAWNVEAGGVWGPFHVMGQYVSMDVDREPPGLDDVTLNAWYVDVGWFLTGESKNYDAGKGQWGSIKPKGIVGKGGIGAWEIAVRYEQADYTDTDAAFIGGEMDLLTVGVNWYVNNTMRFMANYVDTLDYNEDGSGDDGDEPSAFMLRGQIYW
jgi:phosphate-selective porin OprO/OprP